MLSQPLLILFASALLALGLLFSLDNLSPKGCTVIITGESVKLFNCVFDSDFVNYASKLRPFGSL